jgi:hypothetical protein
MPAVDQADFQPSDRNGHAAVVPINLMKSRRLIATLEAWDTAS